MLGLFGLLFMPLAAPPVAGRDAPVLLIDICTADGIARVALSPDGSPTAPESDHRHGSTCWFCLAHAGFTLLAAAPPAALRPEPAFVGHHRPEGRAAVIPAAQFLTVLRSRAPPAA